MNKVSNYFKEKSWGLIILMLICIFFMFAEIINHRFWLSDFEVYYKAAYRILHAQSLYRIESDGFYIFKYSPTSAIYFIPIVIFPFSVAKYIYWLFLSTIIVFGFYLCLKILKPDLINQLHSKYTNIIILSATLIFAIHFLRELHLGQVNYLILFLYIVAIYLYKIKRTTIFSLVLAISIYIKPFTLLFIPYLIVKKKYLELLLFACFSLVLFLLPFILYGSIETTMIQYRLWMNELFIELSNKQDLLANANHTLFSVLGRYSPIRFFLFNSTNVLIYQLVLLIFIGVLFLWFCNINTINSNNEKKLYFSVIELALLISFIPLFVVTDENAFIFFLPVVFVLLLNFGRLKKYEKVLAIVAFLFIGGNFGELLGTKLSKIINDLSLISMGSLILIYLLYTLRIRNSLTEK